MATEDSQLPTGIFTASPKTYHIFHAIIPILFTSSYAFVAQVIATHVVKTYLRSTISEMWLSNLACISINPELVTSISIRELQQPFLNAKTRRIFEWQQMDKRKIVSLYNSYVYINLSQICKSIPNKQIIWKYFLVIE